MDTQLNLKTRYGDLQIPVSEIQRIEFAMRTPEEIVKQIDEAIQKLGSKQYQVRESATKQLIRLREKAYAAVVRAAKHTDLEIATRAKKVLQTLRDTIPEERLKGRESDVVYTADSKIAGRIVAESLTAHTAQFGELSVRLADLLSLGTPTVAKAPPKDVLPDPGNLQTYRGQVGKTFFFRVTGAQPAVRLWGNVAMGGGSLWGTGIYTVDSTLALAAVHSGVLQAGQTGIMRVKIVGPQPAFQGSTQNGITSAPWGPMVGYEVSKWDSEESDKRQ